MAVYWRRQPTSNSCWRREINELNTRAVVLSSKKVNARVICKLIVLMLINALINPPSIKIKVFPADAAVPALSGNTSMALEVAMGRQMVVPVVQIIIGTNTVTVESSNTRDRKSINSPEQKIRAKPKMI